MAAVLNAEINAPAVLLECQPRVAMIWDPSAGKAHVGDQAHSVMMEQKLSLSKLQGCFFIPPRICFPQFHPNDDGINVLDGEQHLPSSARRHPSAPSLPISFSVSSNLIAKLSA